jgi:hypothetical protein
MRLTPMPFARLLLPLLSGLLLAPQAQAAPLDDALAAMARADDESYLQARSAALSLTTLTEVQARRAALEVNDKTWQKAIALATLEAHLSPGAFDALHHSQGLDPAHYLKARRAEPAVARELSRANVHVGALAETLLKTADDFPFADDSSYPDGHRRSLATLRAKEESALRAGLITALARSGDRAAPFVLRDVLRRPRFGDGRLQAAVMMGVATDDVVFAFDALQGTLATTDDDAFRAAIAVGLGKVRSSPSITTLAALARDDASREVRVAALRGLGALGSAWGLKAGEHDDAAKLRADASGTLVTLLSSASTRQERDAVVDALGMVADEGSLPRLRALQSASDAELAAAARHAERRVQRSLRRRR